MESTSEQFARQKIPRTWPGETPTRRRCISRGHRVVPAARQRGGHPAVRIPARGERLKFPFEAGCKYVPAGRRAARTRCAIGFKEAAAPRQAIATISLCSPALVPRSRIPLPGVKRTPPKRLKSHLRTFPQICFARCMYGGRPRVTKAPYPAGAVAVDDFL